MSVLVVSNSDIDTSSAIETLGCFKVTIASNYDHAWGLINRESYDYVLSDLFLEPSRIDRLGLPSRVPRDLKQPLGWDLVMHAIYCGAQGAAVVVSRDDNATDPHAVFGVNDIYGASRGDFGNSRAKIGFFVANRIIMPGIGWCTWRCNQGKDNDGKTCALCAGTGFGRGIDWAPIISTLFDR